MKFVVLSTSKGTVFQSVIDQMRDGSLGATCLGLVTDKKDRGCVAKAMNAKLPVKIVERREGEARANFDERVHQAILELGASSDDFIACIGWMLLLSPEFVGKWRNKILNVHPALLPKFPGAHTHEAVLRSGDKESGMTIHLIDEGMDTGKILVQKKCPVMPSDTVETLKARVQALESEWYPKVLQMFEKDSSTVDSSHRSKT